MSRRAAIAKNTHPRTHWWRAQWQWGRLAAELTESSRLREQRYAHSLTAHAIRIGYLKRRPCAVCGDSNAEAHHNDYSTPLDVIFLCQPHHKRFHAQLRHLRQMIAPHPAKQPTAKQALAMAEFLQEQRR
jgi:hypothetical protein